MFFFFSMPLSIETEEVTDEATTVLEVFDKLVTTFELDLPRTYLIDRNRSSKS